MKPDTKLRRLNLRIAAIMLSALSLASCNGVMYDEEGDCDPHYKARFIFDMNMLYADAFSKEVNAVTLYLIDPATGDIVWQKSERGDRLRQDGYLMDLDVAPGSYQLLAWCGEGRDEHFA
ncbi:FimB/Mfa2 family fimbrial subunit, partial [Duncaniella muris]